ncbi:outer membrane immunogenic protein [Nitrobacteraceae bacterium AZCC 2161]
MKKFLIAAALAGMSVGAEAADLPAKAPYTKAPALAAVYDWTGFYVGVNAGVGVGRDPTRLSIPGLSLEQTNLSPLGAIGGVQAGYNWQTSNWMLGLEADIQASGQHEDSTCLLSCSATTNVRFDRKLEWFGTARARIGYATGPVLTYVTGGFAYGDVKTAITERTPVPVFGGFASPFPVAGTFTNDQIRTGYTFGSGLEAALGGNWTGKIEYLYIDLGSRTGTYSLAGTTHTVDTRYRDNIFRAGLNYRFGSNGTTASLPVANWSGLYIGGNVGSGLGRNRSSFNADIYAEQFDLVPDGFLGGGQIGYNWQSGAWLYGVEADFQGSTQKDNKACITLCSAGLSTSPEQKLPWLGTARGRLGYSIGSTLFYVTGGYAYGEVKTSLREFAGGAAARIDISNTKGGWTAGGGIESPLQFFNWFGPNWTSKTEYLYVDLGRATSNFVAANTPQTFSTAVTEHIFRTGLNYHFNSPVVAKY